MGGTGGRASTCGYRGCSGFGDVSGTVDAASTAIRAGLAQPFRHPCINDCRSVPCPSLKIPKTRPPAARILHPGSRKLFCYWEALRAERPCPTREEFSLAEVRAYAPDLVVLERDHIRCSFRFRLAGSNVCELFKTNLTGMDVFSGWDRFEGDIIHKHLIQSVINFQPTLFRSRFTTDNNEQVAVEFIGLPIRMRGSERIQLVGGFFSFRPANELFHERIVSRELLAIRSVWTEYQNIMAGRPAAPSTDRRFTVITGGLGV